MMKSVRWRRNSRVGCTVSGTVMIATTEGASEIVDLLKLSATRTDSQQTKPGPMLTHHASFPRMVSESKTSGLPQADACGPVGDTSAQILKEEKHVKRFR